MYEKQGRYYADWRDKTGQRLRKSFTSKRAALQFEAEQKELAHPKLKAIGRPLPNSYSLKRRAETRGTSAPPAASSSRPAAHSRPTNSRPPTSPRLTIVSKRAATRR